MFRRRTRRPRRTFRRKRTGYSGARSKYTRSLRNRNVRTPVTRMIAGVPERMFTKLNFVDVATISFFGGVLYSAPYYMSSLYAPKNGSAHQPLYFDQWTNMFTKHRVYGIKYHITCVNRATNEAFYFGVRHQEDTAIESSLQTLMERNDSRIKMRSSVNSGFNACIIKGYMDTAKTVGHAKSSIKNDDNFIGTSSSSPNKMAYLVPYISSNLAGDVTFEYTVRLTFYCEFFNQVAVSAS